MISSYLYMVIPGKFGTNYYICQGLDPKIDEYDMDKVKNLEKKLSSQKLIFFLFSSL